MTDRQLARLLSTAFTATWVIGLLAAIVMGTLYLVT